MKYLIDVKQCDISHGVPRLMGSCPVALGIKRALRSKHVRVISTFITVDGKRGRSPKKVENFVYDFDSYKPVKPFSFTVDMK